MPPWLLELDPSHGPDCACPVLDMFLPEPATVVDVSAWGETLAHPTPCLDRVIVHRLTLWWWTGTQAR